MTKKNEYELMREYGDHRARAGVVESQHKGTFANTRYGDRMVRDAGALLLKATKEWSKDRTRGTGKRAAQLLKDIGLEQAVVITVRKMVNMTATGDRTKLTVTHLRVTLGNSLFDEAAWSRFKREEPVGHRYMSKKHARANAMESRRIHKSMLARMSANPNALDWDSKDRMLIAAAMLDLAVRHCGIFRHTVAGVPETRERTRTKNIITLHPAVFDWIASGIEQMAETRPLYLPVRSKPLDWGKGSPGGFPSTDVPPVSLVTARDQGQRDSVAHSDCPEVYEAVNRLQDTSWQINSTVLDALGHVVENNWHDVGVPVPPGDTPKAPAGEFDKDSPAWRSFIHARTEWRHDDEVWRSRSMGLGQALALGREYRDGSFYYVHRLDFRGRAYPVGGPLQYQGADYLRALTSFAETKPLGFGDEWFLATGANLFGVDKVPIHERVEWVETNQEELIRCGQDPLTHRIWRDADKPFQALAWCEEFSRYVHEGDKFESRLPLGMDGSNNGLQIYSLLLRDEVGGLATNCVPTDTPQDIYSDVAREADAILVKYAKSHPDPKVRRWSKRISAFCASQGLPGLPRSACKRPVMVLPYGGTLYSTQGYLAEWYHDFVRGRSIPKEVHPFPEGDSYEALNFLGGVVWEAIGGVVLKAREAMDWLHAVANEISHRGQHISWTTPLGLVCQQAYQKGRTKRVRLKAGGSVSLSVWEGTGEPDPRKARNGLCPNFIHSLDASAMFMSVNLAAAEGATHFRAVHDEYATHGADSPALSSSLRAAFSSIFSNDLLAAFRAEVMLQFPEAEIPEPPTSGSLDLSQLQDATYFFA